MVCFFQGCCCCCSMIYVLLAVYAVLKIYLKYRVKICSSARRLDGKTVIVTGANAGIGKVTALELARRRARVILACRDLNKANQARDEIVLATGNQDVIVKKLDLASLQSVRDFAADILSTEPRLDVLINNAGMGGVGSKMTDDGLQYGMQVNHFGPFLLTNLLVDLLKKSTPSRIVFVSSITHRLARLNLDDLNFEKSYLPLLGDFQVYSSSKLANILTANTLAKKLEKTGVTVNSLHPGTVDTEVWRNLPFGIRHVVHVIVQGLFKTPLEGAQTTIHCAVSEECDGVTGKYFTTCAEIEPARLAQDEALGKKLWEKSEALVKLNTKKRR